MRGLLILLLTLSVVSCNQFQKKSATPVPNAGMTTMTFNGFSPFEFAQKVDVNLLKDMDEQSRMDIGYLLSKDEWSLLDSEKRSLITANDTYIPLIERVKSLQADDIILRHGNKIISPLEFILSHNSDQLVSIFQHDPSLKPFLYSKISDSDKAFLSKEVLDLLSRND